MPFTVHLHPNLQLATVRLSGLLDGNVILNALQACYDHPLWVPGTRMLWDYRQVAQVVLEPGDMQRVVDYGFAQQARGGSALDVNLVDCEKGLHALASRSFVAYRKYRKGALRNPCTCCSPGEAADVLELPPEVVDRLLAGEE